MSKHLTILAIAFTCLLEKYTDMALNGGTGGKAIVNGSFSKTSSSSSTSSSNSSLVDVTITFQQYETDGLRLDGVLRFFDSYSYRMACGSAGCASSTKTSVSYLSEDGYGSTFSPVAIKFNSNGTNLSDAILLDAGKSLTHWSVKVTDKSGKVITFSY
jgi:hypothetical protein